MKSFGLGLEKSLGLGKTVLFTSLFFVAAVFLEGFFKVFVFQSPQQIRVIYQVLMSNLLINDTCETIAACPIEYTFFLLRPVYPELTCFR